MPKRKVKVKVKKHKPLYPEAPDKIEYYDNLITELTTCKDALYEAKKWIGRTTYPSKVENPDAEGPYYDEYVQHKGDWFTNNQIFYNKFGNYGTKIIEQIDKATDLKIEWTRKAQAMIEYEEEEEREEEY